MDTFVQKVRTSFFVEVEIDAKYTQTTEELDAVALGTMYLNITGLSVGMGLATAMDTLCTQAYGAKKPKLLGIYFQRGLWILSIALIPITIISLLSGSILKMLGQNEEVSVKAGHFVTLSILCLPSLYVYELLRKMLQAMNIMMPMLFVAAASNIFNIGFCYYLVSETSLGYKGAAVARSVSCVFMPLCLLVYIKISNAFETIWDGTQRFLAQLEKFKRKTLTQQHTLNNTQKHVLGWDFAESVKDWKNWIQIGMGGALSMCLEWWAFEILGLLAGLLPEATTEIGANAIMFNTTAVTYMFYLGVAIASTVRVGNGLGSGNQKAVRRSAFASLVINTVIGISLGAIVYFCRDSLPRVFTTDDSIRDRTSDTLWILALYQVLDATNGACRGILQGAGEQSVAAIICFVAYYLIGIPLGLILTFTFKSSALHHKLSGLWVGVSLGLFVSLALSLLHMSRLDLNSLVERAKKRAARDASVALLDDVAGGGGDDDDV